jgi:hypothetical protein
VEYFIFLYSSSNLIFLIEYSGLDLLFLHKRLSFGIFTDITNHSTCPRRHKAIVEILWKNVYQMGRNESLTTGSE